MGGPAAFIKVTPPQREEQSGAGQETHGEEYRHGVFVKQVVTGQRHPGPESQKNSVQRGFLGKARKVARTERAEVWEGGCPRALGGRARSLQKAAEDCRSPRRWRAGWEVLAGSRCVLNSGMQLFGSARVFGARREGNSRLALAVWSFGRGWRA